MHTHTESIDNQNLRNEMRTGDHNDIYKREKQALTDAREKLEGASKADAISQLAAACERYEERVFVAKQEINRRYGEQA